jgi:phosphohistidine phosphatase
VVNDANEIQLHLLRHAHAGDPVKWTGPDSSRPLSEKGQRQAVRLGLFLADAGFLPDLIMSSPLARALETARLVATPLGLPIVVREELAESLDLESLERLLTGSGNPRRPLMVGHDPDFSMLAAELTGVAELPLRKGTLIRVDTRRPLLAGGGLLRWLLPPDLLTNAPEG